MMTAKGVITLDIDYGSVLAYEDSGAGFEKPAVHEPEIGIV